VTDLCDHLAGGSVQLTDRTQALAVLAGLRRERGLTQADFAERLHVHRKTICYRETGHVGTEIGELIRAARALGYTVALIPIEPAEEPA
jgi:DNA-binding XRE family transcriptional regulator